MWQQSFCLIVSVTITGSLSVSWNMVVSPVVFVPRGQDAVLGCSFTHSRQQDYSGTITVRWLARESAAPPLLICSVKNDSVGGLGDCSPSGLKYSLAGDPRRGELSLLIRRVHLEDNGTYFCRVELPYMWSSDQETQLYVTVEPQISSLSVVETSSRGPRRLQCEAEGHPLPTVTWLSASGTPLGDRARTSAIGTYRLVSSVPYPEEEEEVLTCRVESRLGGAERRFPGGNTLMITVTVCGLIGTMLSTGVLFYLRNRARVRSPSVHENTSTARAETPPIYENAHVVENHRLQSSDCPAEGDVELQLVYSTVSLTRDLSAQRASSKREQQESDTLYSPVNVQQ